MSKPEDGTQQSFYCDCCKSSRNESFKDKDARTEERIINEQNGMATTWICKCRYIKSFNVFTGFFSSESVSLWMYYWECMNCGKVRDIGVWDSKGAGYGDGKQL